MKIEKDIIKLLSKEYPNKEVQGIRFLNKVDENLWSFRYTFKDGDYLSLSDELAVKYEGISLKICQDSILPKFVSPIISTIDWDSSIKNKKYAKKK